MADFDDPVRPLKILIVDDSAPTRKMMRRVLEGAGHSCDEAEDGADALTQYWSSIQDHTGVGDDDKNQGAEGAAYHSRRLSLSSVASPNVAIMVQPLNSGSNTDIVDGAFGGNKNSTGGYVMCSRSEKSPLFVGNELMSIPTRSTYDVILMDFIMPNMDGPTATRELRRLGYEGLIVGVTGNALPTDIDHFLAHGASKVLLKPLRMDEFKAATKEGESITIIHISSCHISPYLVDSTWTPLYSVGLVLRCFA
jgi:CheY-like chemotaxis protein